MNSELATVDIAIVLLYVLGTIGLGAWFSRRQHNLNTYFVGDRNVSWWLILVSIVATETSTVTFLSVPGVAFKGDFTFLQLTFGYVVGRALIAWFLVPQYLRGEMLSAYQLLQQRFDRSVQRSASAVFLFTRVVADGLRLYLAALLLQQFTGWNGSVSVLAIGGATILYTLLGGMQAVIWTDTIQFVIYIFGAIVAGICIIRQIPQGLPGFLAAGEQAHKFTVLNLTPDPTQTFTLWTGLIGGACFTMASHGADQMMVQRYLCSRSVGQARTALVLSGGVVLLQFLLFLAIGAGLFVLHQQGTLRLPEGTRDDEVFGVFIIHFLPHGIIGLVIAAVLAASMCTLSSSLNSAAGAFVNDFYRPLRPALKEQDYLIVSRWMTLFWGATRMGVALFALRWLHDRSVIDQVFIVAGFTTGMILGLFLLGSLRRPVPSWAALTGLAAGFVVVFMVWLPPMWGSHRLAWPWYAPVGTVTTVVVALAVNLWRPHYGSPTNRGEEPGLDKTG
ncbi:MAG TPA: sodium:solute symporter [Gemmataceae bacterium]|nr:sodium:solute symporter [Gemmataceae bacterium]